MAIGFIGLGNVGSKLAGTLVRQGTELVVLDTAPEAMAPLVGAGAKPAASPQDLASRCEVVITCLPSPAIVANVMEASDGVLSGMRPGSIWVEMSTTDAREVLRLGELIALRGGQAADCPVSGGCHRAATGNISIFAGCNRRTFERLLPLLTVMGRRVLHTGDLGSASQLKVVTNYLATANLIAVTEALAACAKVGLDLGVAYEAIAASSGTSFVHETESQVILNGSRDINFTMDLVKKDVGLFNSMAREAGMTLELATLVAEVFDDGIERYGPREWSPNIIRRLEDEYGLDVRAPGFPAEIVDDEPEELGGEIVVRR
ncbi:MAG: NAD(P)-dependent oxidoreductase [Candidatus Nanopelagicales bacterium]|nr:NAD(P)-dependent oxidoreductase [Actinomycetota bacterium]NDA50057.1 NAD(P)-dependent oxidoreductase [Actinomycetota bacterium]NDA60304.1 NAD(P)-dependent oxidoreductase [Actinomycetota bacterium]NDH19262.1 NAD(P)-dependent oxidoreductase [Actinomycetota bacterium]